MKSLIYFFTIMLLILVPLAGCKKSSDAPLGGSIVKAEEYMFVFDGAHNDGNEYFYFLPPMVSNPEYGGLFDYEQEPMVTIMEDDLEIARFEMGDGSDHIRVDMEDEHYIVNWKMKEHTFDLSKIYRISVWLMEEEVGYIELDFDGMQRMANLNRTVPIKFRIEEGVLDVSITPDNGPVGTGFTIYDPQGRIQNGDMVIFHEVGELPTDGTDADNKLYSADGKMLNGDVPAGLATATLHHVSVRPSATDPARFSDLEFMVTD